MPRPSPYPGVNLVEPTSLAPELKKFRNDDLLFIDHCTYHPAEGKSSLKVVAMTPQAFFVCDANGKMERATKLEYLQGVTVQNVSKKKLIGSEEHMHMVVRIPREYDVHISFEKTKNSDPATAMLAVLRAVQPVVLRGAFPVKEVGAEEKIESHVTAQRPRGFLTPQEILQHNKQRQQSIDLLEKASAEIYALRDEIVAKRESNEAKRAELETLESAVGTDGSQLRAERDKLHARQTALQREVTHEELEQTKAQADTARLNEQLAEERGNAAQLIESQLRDSGEAAGRQQAEMFNLRKKGQQRELDRANTRLAGLRAVVAARPTYSGDARMVSIAQGLEDRVAASLQRFEADLESSNKVEKFLDTMNAEIERLAKEIAAVAAEKEDLLVQCARNAAARTASVAGDPLAASRTASLAPVVAAAPAVAAAAAPPAASDLLDDDLLGGGGGGGGNPASIDDDLLGGGGEVPGASAAPAEENVSQDML